MTPEKQQKLFSRFGFFHPEKPFSHSLMGFGFECGDGWFDIIWNLCEEIEQLLQDEPMLREKFEVVQVKEKFGTLRFYTDFATEEIFEAIRRAEKLSSQTCEVCGEPGTLDSVGGWTSCLCEDHRQML